MHMCKIDKYIGQVRLSTETSFWNCNNLYIGISKHMITYWCTCCQISTKYAICHLIVAPIFVDGENQRNWNEYCCAYSKMWNLSHKFRHGRVMFLFQRLLSISFDGFMISTSNKVWEFSLQSLVSILVLKPWLWIQIPWPGNSNGYTNQTALIPNYQQTYRSSWTNINHWDFKELYY